VGAVDVLFNTLSTDGTYGPAGVIGSLEDEFAKDVCIAQNEKIYISGYTDGYEVGLYDVFLSYSTNNQPSGANHFELIRVDDDLITSIELPALKKLIAYPNPTHDHIRFKGLTAEISELEIFDIRGKLVLQRNFNSAESLSLVNLNVGIYIAVIRADGIVQRTVIQKY